MTSAPNPYSIVAETVLRWAKSRDSYPRIASESYRRGGNHQRPLAVISPWKTQTLRSLCRDSNRRVAFICATFIPRGTAEWFARVDCWLRSGNPASSSAPAAAVESQMIPSSSDPQTRLPASSETSPGSSLKTPSQSPRTARQLWWHLDSHPAKKIVRWIRCVVLQLLPGTYRQVPQLPPQQPVLTLPCLLVP